MSNQHIQVNDNDLVPIANVKRLAHITDEDRQSLASLGEHVKPERFNTRFEFADKSKSYEPVTIDEIASQGVELVSVDDAGGVFIPSQNIIRASTLTDEDRQTLEEEFGRSLRPEFKSRVETKAGTVLATITADTIMRRMGHPYKPVLRSESLHDPAAETCDHDR